MHRIFTILSIAHEPCHAKRTRRHDPCLQTLMPLTKVPLSYPWVEVRSLPTHPWLHRGPWLRIPQRSMQVKMNRGFQYMPLISGVCRSFRETPWTRIKYLIKLSLIKVTLVGLLKPLAFFSWPSNTSPSSSGQICLLCDLHPPPPDLRFRAQSFPDYR